MAVGSEMYRGLNGNAAHFFVDSEDQNRSPRLAPIYFNNKSIKLMKTDRQSCNDLANWQSGYVSCVHHQ